MAVPFDAGDGEGHGGKTRVGLPVPSETVLQRHDPLEAPLPLPRQQSAGLQHQRRFRSPCLGRGRDGRVGRFRRFGFDRCPILDLLGRQTIEHFGGLAIQIAERVRLDAIGHQPKKQRARKMGRREPAPSIAPLQAKLLETETLQDSEFRIDGGTIDDADRWQRWR